MQFLDLPAERALFDSTVRGLVACVPLNERPLMGLAGLLDWRLQGWISQCIRSGVISGREGECSYFPISRHGQVFHFLLAGAGVAPLPGKRQELPSNTLAALRKNLQNLGIPNFAVSRSDLGQVSETYLSSHFEKLPVVVVP